jgi:hypothetical protein
MKIVHEGANFLAHGGLENEKKVKEYGLLIVKLE